MNSRQAELLRDVGRLLKKYDARDWRPLLRLLTSNPSLLLDAVSSVQQKSARKTRSKTTVQTSARSKKKVIRKKAAAKAESPKARPSGTAKKENDSAGKQSIYRQALSRASASELQALYMRAYKRKAIPKSRAELIEALEKYLRKLSDRERDLVLRSSRGGASDSQDAFRRWVEIISKGGRN